MPSATARSSSGPRSRSIVPTDMSGWYRRAERGILRGWTVGTSTSSGSSSSAFNDRDAEATLAVVHPEIAFQPLKVHGAEVWHGRDGVAELWRRMGEVGLDHTLDITELRVRPDGVIAAIGARACRAGTASSGSTASRTG